MAVGYRMTDYRLAGDAPPVWLRFADRVAYWLVFRNIRRMIGSTAAASPSRVLRRSRRI